MMEKLPIVMAADGWRKAPSLTVRPTRCANGSRVSFIVPRRNHVVSLCPPEVCRDTENKHSQRGERVEMSIWEQINEELKSNTAIYLPFVIMDYAYSIFCKDIKPLDLRHGAKKLCSDWLKNYHLFNSRIFVLINEEGRDYLIDRMDEYTEYIDYPIMLVRVAIMDLVSKDTFERQQAVSSLMLCNILAQAAQITWKAVASVMMGSDRENPELLALKNISSRLCNCVCRLDEDINPNDSPKLNEAVNNYLSKTAEWLNIKYNRTK